MLTIRYAFLTKIISIIFTHISTQYARIFSSPLKKKHNFSLSFLDILIKCNSRKGSIITHSLLSATIYRKPMHTYRYLYSTSHHPKHQTLTVAKPLLSRINITDNTQKHSELQNICSTLYLNGFSTRTTFLTSRQPCSQNTQYNHFTSSSYIQLNKCTSKKSEEF